jgi:glucosylglycerate synthase
VLEPTRAGETLAPEVVIGVPAEPDRLVASEAALAIQTGLRDAFPGKAGLSLLLTGDPRGAVTPGEPIPLAAQGPAEPPAYYTGGHSGPGAALPTLLEVTVSLGAPVCALLEPMPRPHDPRWLNMLIDPVLTGGFDLVAPAYTRRRFEGVLVTGIVYPLTRALFGHRLRQPLGPEIVLSRRLAEVLLHDEGWRTDPVYAGGDLWVITKAIAREGRMAQVYLGPRGRPPAQPGDASQAISKVLGTVFHEMELHAPRWQRVRGSKPVTTQGEEHAPEDPAHPVQPPAPGPLVSAFTLGWQDLRPLWSVVLPPQTLLALQRIPREAPEAFRMPDALWARVVYDFAVGWRVRSMDREQLLRSLTPLYLGWLASFVNEVAPLSVIENDARIERLCAAFEAEKPYLISRWRWPDRFSP